jgi:hypothetical protein
MLLLKHQREKIGSTLKRYWSNLHGQNWKKRDSVGDIELEDFKERYRAFDKHEAMISI